MAHGHYSHPLILHDAEIQFDHSNGKKIIHPLEKILLPSMKIHYPNDPFDHHHGVIAIENDFKMNNELHHQPRKYFPNLDNSYSSLEFMISDTDSFESKFHNLKIKTDALHNFFMLQMIHLNRKIEQIQQTHGQHIYSTLRESSSNSNDSSEKIRDINHQLQHEKTENSKKTDEIAKLRTGIQQLKNKIDALESHLHFLQQSNLELSQLYHRLVQEKKRLTDELNRLRDSSLPRVISALPANRNVHMKGLISSHSINSNSTATNHISEQHQPHSNGDGGLSGIVPGITDPHRQMLM